MIEKQKQAIKILNQLRCNDVINENDYFLLLEFIVEQHSESTTYPWTRRLTEDPQPLDPIYGKFGITCSQSNIKTTLTEKEEQ